MTLDDQAKLVQQKAQQLQVAAMTLEHLAEAILFNVEGVTLPNTTKQAILAKYQTKKTQLQSLVKELP